MASSDPYTQKNKDEPGTEEKINALSDFVKSSKFGMMTTRIADSGLLVSRCMAVAAQESGGVDYLFHTNTESGKTDDLNSDEHVNISFLTPSGAWASISGTASIITDRDTVKKYYTPTLKTWLGDQGDGVHDGSENDPRIGIIKVKALTATYALPKGWSVGRGIEIVKGAITGETAEVSQLREISEQEIKQWRSSH
ncbi:protein bli-3 [Cladophialophora yegresii CBS 114405]|uniref:Protein bli-3 n=1 Tax=Cladophialophora yegresii CBS 114405 TaxID=1182544 RepID=W9VPR2_9EURO|nr:protein bli-3 [Cladophialophora yegresii CBS 114405]EXJ57533.1 protein bli-3 [Cladophialophora yegresii CBS 114405]